MVMVGVAAISSENVAVTVTVVLEPRILSASVSVKVTVGATVSTVKVILALPVRAFPSVSLPVMVKVKSDSVEPRPEVSKL